MERVQMVKGQEQAEEKVTAAEETKVAVAKGEAAGRDRDRVKARAEEKAMGEQVDSSYFK